MQTHIRQYELNDSLKSLSETPFSFRIGAIFNNKTHVLNSKDFFFANVLCLDFTRMSGKKYSMVLGITVCIFDHVISQHWRFEWNNCSHVRWPIVWTIDLLNTDILIRDIN